MFNYTYVHIISDNAIAVDKTTPSKILQYISVHYSSDLDWVEKNGMLLLYGIKSIAGLLRDNIINH